MAAVNDPVQPEEPDNEPDGPEQAGWTVLDPDGNVVATGGQTVVTAEANAGEAGDPDERD